MVAKATIEASIKARVGSTSMSQWRIGLTHDRVERKSYWKETERKDVSCWVDWHADSLADAEAIEASFIRRGMDGGTGGSLSAGRAVYVYIF